jgi:hypothetical protein
MTSEAREAMKNDSTRPIAVASPDAGDGSRPGVV